MHWKKGVELSERCEFDGAKVPGECFRSQEGVGAVGEGENERCEKQQLGSNKHMEVSYNLLFGPTAKQQLLTNGGEPSKTREEPNKQIVGEEFDNQLVGEEISVGTKDDQVMMNWNKP